MEAILIALIGAIGALVAAIVSGIFSNRKLGKELALHDHKSGSGQGTLSQEHQSLSKEHQEIIRSAERESAKIVWKTEQVNDQIAQVASDVRVVRERQAEERAKRDLQYASLTEAQKILYGNAAEIGRFAQEFARLAAENEKIRTDNTRLRAEKEKAQQELASLKERMRQMEPQPQPQPEPPKADMTSPTVDLDPDAGFDAGDLT